MPILHYPRTVHEQRCRDMFGLQNGLPKEGSLQRGDEYRWHGTTAGWGTSDTQMVFPHNRQMVFPHKQKLLPPGPEDLLDFNTCEAFNEFIRQKRPDKFYGTLPSLSKDDRCPGLDESRSGQNSLISRRCSTFLQSWSQVLMVKCPEGYSPYCLEHESVAEHNQRLAVQIAEFASFRETLQDASSAAGTSAALSPAVVPSSVAREADSKKRPNSSERKAPLRKPQRSSRRLKRSTKHSQSVQDQPSVTALAHQFATEISQAVSPASTSQDTFAEPATQFDPYLQVSRHDERLTAIPSSAQSNDSKDGNYGQYLHAQDLDSPFDLNAFAQLDEMDNDWKDQYETSKSQYSDYMSSAPPDNGDTGLDWTHQQSNPSL